MERPFAEFRGRQGLTRFHRRGVAGARVEFALHCIAFNLKWAIGREGVTLVALVCVIGEPNDAQRRWVTVFFLFLPPGVFSHGDASSRRFTTV